MKHLLFALLLVAALFVAVSAGPVQAGEDKVTICHLPPGNPENRLTITIGESAVAAHLANHLGDFVGGCEH